MRYHVVVTGSRPEKGADGKYLDVPTENVQYISTVLAMLDPELYVALYHGAGAGVDSVADDWAFLNGIRVKQFPAYWYDPTKKGNVDKYAGHWRSEQMLRAAVNAAYKSDDESVIVLTFHNKPLEESKGTAHTVGLAQKFNLTVRKFPLPVKAPPAEVSADAPFAEV